ncbi:C6 zinc finger domain-containing protein [Colletotrichum filicis]|nr:C6 zinc finger domain-containing protein [Colletotrichum filicis]
MCMRDISPMADSIPRDRRRKAHRKVKTGCKACKTRRQKCDERRPICSGCTRHSTECLYLFVECIVRRQVLETAYLQPIARVPDATTSYLIPPSRDLNLSDLELLHQYLTSTCKATSQLPEVTAHIQTTIPHLAQDYPFLMRGILAEAAIHLSWLHPGRKSHYAPLASNHHRLGLPDFRAALQTIDTDNCDALMAYSKGLVWCAFAWHESFSADVQAVSTVGTISWLPQWFNLLRGSYLIVESCRRWSTNCLYALPPQLDDMTEFFNSTDGCKISALRIRLTYKTYSPAYEALLSTLQYSFALASMRHHNTPLRNAINNWMGALPNDYISLLQKEEPWALVLLAHFCILIHRSETRWFMKGHGSQLLQSTIGRLDNQWKDFVQWPLEEIGVCRLPYIW